MKIIIIEDEAPTARELKKILEGLDNDINVLAILSSVASATRWLRENAAPDLIFSDIQLGDGLSFSIFNEVQTRTPVIFCTAFDQYAIQAFTANSIDYILKPVEEEMVEKSLKKYGMFREHYSGDTFNRSLNKAIGQIEGAYKQVILVQSKERMIPVKTTEVSYAYAANGLVMIRTIHNDEFLLRYTMDQLEGILNPSQFFKVNRQFILNRNSIIDIEHHFNRRLLVRTDCKTPEPIIISRIKAPDFLRWVEL